MIKQTRPRKIVKRSITKEQFLNLLSKAAQPIKKQEPVSTSIQTSESHHSDDCAETHTHSDKTEDT